MAWKKSQKWRRVRKRQKKGLVTEQKKGKTLLAKGWRRAALAGGGWAGFCELWRHTC